MVYLPPPDARCVEPDDDASADRGKDPNASALGLVFHNPRVDGDGVNHDPKNRRPGPFDATNLAYGTFWFDGDGQLHLEYSKNIHGEALSAFLNQSFLASVSAQLNGMRRTPQKQAKATAEESERAGIRAPARGLSATEAPHEEAPVAGNPVKKKPTELTLTAPRARKRAASQQISSPLAKARDTAGEEYKDYRDFLTEERTFEFTPNETVRITNFLSSLFDVVQQLACKVILKQWIRLLEPRKQSAYPYNSSAQQKRSRGAKVGKGSGDRGGEDGSDGREDESSRESNDGRDGNDGGCGGDGPEERDGDDAQKKKPELSVPPPWWPEGLRHIEPDHLQKKERMILGPYMLRLRHNTSWMDNLSDELRAGYTERLNGERGWIGKLEEAMKENTLEFEQDRDMRKERRDARRQIIEVMFQIAKAEESFMMGERDGEDKVSIVLGDLPLPGSRSGRRAAVKCLARAAARADTPSVPKEAQAQPRPRKEQGETPAAKDESPPEQPGQCQPRDSPGSEEQGNVHQQQQEVPRPPQPQLEPETQWSHRRFDQPWQPQQQSYQWPPQAAGQQWQQQKQSGQRQQGWGEPLRPPQGDEKRYAGQTRDRLRQQQEEEQTSPITGALGSQMLSLAIGEVSSKRMRPRSPEQAASIPKLAVDEDVSARRLVHRASIMDQPPRTGVRASTSNQEVGVVNEAALPGLQSSALEPNAPIPVPQYSQMPVDMQLMHHPSNQPPPFQRFGHLQGDTSYYLDPTVMRQQERNLGNLAQIAMYDYTRQRGDPPPEFSQSPADSFSSQTSPPYQSQGQMYAPPLEYQLSSDGSPLYYGSSYMQQGHNIEPSNMPMGGVQSAPTMASAISVPYSTAESQDVKSSSCMMAPVAGHFRTASSLQHPAPSYQDGSGQIYRL